MIFEMSLNSVWPSLYRVNFTVVAVVEHARSLLGIVARSLAKWFHRRGPTLTFPGDLPPKRFEKKPSALICHHTPELDGFARTRLKQDLNKANDAAAPRHPPSFVNGFDVTPAKAPGIP